MSTAGLRAADHKFLWHPFTPMAEWFDDEPLVIERGEGVWLLDGAGKKYLDGVSSLWCNVHGHRHPVIDRHVREQLERIAHTTFLGLTHAPAIKLAEKLVHVAPPGLTRVFFSDNGSTAVEAAVKIAYQFQQQSGQNARKTFAAIGDAYHGDTLGSVSMGGIGLFHGIYKPLLFDVVRVPSPAPFHTLPIDAGAPLDALKQHPGAAPLLEVFSTHGEKLAALVLEPLVQGAAGIRLHPEGFLALARRLCDAHGVLLIADEVATGFGRTGRMFACEHENVAPDLLCVAKGLTGGYLPVAATLATEKIFAAFLGAPERHRTFFHGHTYTANPLGCAAALGSFEVFENERVLARLPALCEKFAAAARSLASHQHVGEIRVRGLMAGIDLLEHPASGRAFDEGLRTGQRVCRAARKHGIIIRPLGDTLVWMPPLAIEPDEIELLAAATRAALDDIFRP